VMMTWRMGWPCKQEKAGHQICIDDIRSALQTVTSRQHDPPRQRMKLFANFLAGTPLLPAPAMPLCSPSPQRLQLPPESALLPHTPHLPQLQLLPTAWLQKPCCHLQWQSPQLTTQTSACTLMAPANGPSTVTPCCLANHSLM
jgi:hypothetical protein